MPYKDNDREAWCCMCGKFIQVLPCDWQSNDSAYHCFDCNDGEAYCPSCIKKHKCDN